MHVNVLAATSIYSRKNALWCHSANADHPRALLLNVFPCAAIRNPVGRALRDCEFGGEDMVVLSSGTSPANLDNTGIGQLGLVLARAVRGSAFDSRVCVVVGVGSALEVRC